jgi:hypothetical protein
LSNDVRAQDRVALETPPEPTDAERQVADLIPIDADPETAGDVLERVPIWFHTFGLDRSRGIYTHGIARDHRYRIPALPEDFSGPRVLDIGTFDGFYAFLAEVRGAARVVAVDNEQYKEWISSRWGVELQGGEGFAAMRQVLGSEVDYRLLDAFELDQLDEAFDLVLCFGILHRLRDAGLSVNTGTVNYPEILTRVLEFAPDAIGTDRPHELRAAAERLIAPAAQP